MRTAFLGAGEVTLRTAELLIGWGHEVIIIEADAEKIDMLSEEMDCSFLHGDGSNPAVLRQVDPTATDVLFCLTNSDQVNIIASLVGRSLGFRRVIASIGNPEYEGICRELGLEDTIIPSRTISRYLADMVHGVDSFELSRLVKGDVRLFPVLLKEGVEGTVSDLDLPDQSWPICVYRGQKFFRPEEKTKLHEGDEVIILTHRENLAALHDRWPKTSDSVPTTKMNKE